MKTKYADFLKLRGKSVSEINPGSDEMALAANEALEAIEILKENQIVIYGGDIMSIENNRLIYAYQLWGSEYQHLNWHCDRLENEQSCDFSIRSYEIAKIAINEAIKTSESLEKECLIVLVV